MNDQNFEFETDEDEEYKAYYDALLEESKEQGFEIQDDELIKYHGNDKDIFIPDIVTKIRDYAFFGCSSLRSVGIGSNVTSIGCFAFCCCSRLDSVRIGERVTSIGRFAFCGCSSLESVELGENVTSIGEEVFSGCTALASVKIGDNVTSIGERAFSWTQWFKDYPDDFVVLGGILLAYRGHDSTVIIPDGIKGIASEVFSEFDDLKFVIVPESVTSIGDHAFPESGYRPAPAIVYLPDAVKEIAYPALQKFEDSSFILRLVECTGIFNTPWHEAYSDGFIIIDGTLYLYLGNDSAVTIPDGVKIIGDRAFRGCRLESVVIPDSVTSIGNEAFSGCRCLKSVTIPGSVTSIGDRAFSECEYLKSISIPASVTSVGKDLVEEYYDFINLVDHELNLDCITVFDCRFDIRDYYDKYYVDNDHYYADEDEDLRADRYETYTRMRQEIFELLINKNSDVGLPYDMRCDCIWNALRYGTNGTKNRNLLERAQEYASGIMKYLLENPEKTSQEKSEDISFMLEVNVITKENIDQCICTAIDSKEYELQLMLTNYKQEKKWYQNPDENLKL